MSKNEVLYPNITVQLTGKDGNAFAVIAEVSEALKNAGLVNEAKKFTQDAFQSESYDELLQLCMETVNVK